MSDQNLKANLDSLNGVKNYGREVSDADVRAAEFQNFQRLGDASRKVLSSSTLKGLHPDSPQYGRVMTALLQAEDGARARGRDPYRNAEDSMAAAASVLPQVYQSAPVRGAYRALGLDIPEPPRPQRVQQAAPRKAVSPVTTGSVNGKQMYMPTAGNYTNGAFRDEMAKMVPGDASYGVSVDDVQASQDRLAGAGYVNPNMTYEQQAIAGQAQNQASAAVAAQKRQQELDDAQRAHERAMELRRLQNEPDILKAGQPDTGSLESWHGNQVAKWSADQVKAQRLLASIEGMPDRVSGPNGVMRENLIMDAEGNSVPVATIRAQAKALSYDQPTYAQSLQQLGTPAAMQELARQGQQMGQELAAQKQMSRELDGKRQMAFKQLKPEYRKQYQSWSQAEKNAFWESMGLGSI